MQRGDLRWPRTSAREIAIRTRSSSKRSLEEMGRSESGPGLWHDLHRAILAPHRGAIAPGVRGRPHRADLAGGGRQRLH
jgi:hypothetical protein|tara:strand:- start:1085 stop:1321 length:237 start_codon:yes stop_codon:yes gene_type:complete